MIAPVAGMPKTSDGAVALLPEPGDHAERGRQRDKVQEDSLDGEDDRAERAGQQHERQQRDHREHQREAAEHGVLIVELDRALAGDADDARVALEGWRDGAHGLRANWR